MIGIILVKNITKNKCLICSSTHINDRISHIKSSLKSNTFSNIDLQLDYNNGDDIQFFVINTFKVCSTAKLANLKLDSIRYYQSNDPKFGFNTPSKSEKLIESQISINEYDISKKLKSLETEVIQYKSNYMDLLNSYSKKLGELENRNLDLNSYCNEFEEFMTKYKELEHKYENIKNERDKFYNIILKQYELLEVVNDHTRN